MGVRPEEPARILKEGGAGLEILGRVHVVEFVALVEGVDAIVDFDSGRQKNVMDGEFAPVEVMARLERMLISGKIYGCRNRIMCAYSKVGGMRVDCS